MDIESQRALGEEIEEVLQRHGVAKAVVVYRGEDVMDIGIVSSAADLTGEPFGFLHMLGMAVSRISGSNPDEFVSADSKGPGPRSEPGDN